MADDESKVAPFSDADVAVGGSVTAPGSAGAGAGGGDAASTGDGDAKKSDGGGGDGEEEDEEEEEFVFQPSALWAEKGQDAAEEETWTFDHGRLLYLMSLYAKCAQTPNDEEGWLRQLPLNVLMFQGITQGVLDFDYAPQSGLISSGGRSQRVWLNVTQEGKAAVDDLREAGLINGLKVRCWC